MNHTFLQALPFCSQCGLLFQDHKEFSSTCPGKHVDDAPGVPPPTPLPHGANVPEQPGPRVMYAINQALEMIRAHYDEPIEHEFMPPGPKQLRMTARSLAKMAGVDPDVVVIQGSMAKMPKGAIQIDFHILNAVPYWVLFVPDAQRAIEAVGAATIGQEIVRVSHVAS